MALDDLLSRLEAGECVTPVPPGQNLGVTPKPSQLLAVTHVTPVTRQTISGQASKCAEAAILLTFEYFHRHGIELLAEDLAFLRWHLPRSARTQRAAIGQYIAVWLSAMDSEPKNQRKQNVGRRDANTWLRLKQDNHSKDCEL
jgi:hypothetical protein